MKQRATIVLDVGGTQIKANMIDSTGQLYEVTQYFDAMATKDRKVILDNFTYILNIFLRLAKKQNIALCAIGLAFPGPFDYTNGISKMKNIGKYDSIYGINLKAFIRTVCQDAGYPGNIPITFCNDATAFGLGTALSGLGKEYQHVMSLTIGTGLGSCFVANQRVEYEIEGANQAGMLFDLPYHNQTVDDYFSQRGLIALAAQNNINIRNGLDLFNLAKQHDESAQKVFNLFGEKLIEALRVPIASFKPDVLVLGGQISKSSQWIVPGMQKQLKKQLLPIVVESDTTKTIYQGIQKIAELKEN